MKSFSRTLTTWVASAALLVVSSGLAQAYDPLGLDGDEPVGVVAAPWTADIKGVAVPTRFDVEEACHEGG